MIKSYRTIVAGGLGLVAILGAGSAMAQARVIGPLDRFVDRANVSATDLQKGVGHAVQATCQSLNALGVLAGGTNGAALPANSPQLDLWARCAEMVNSATNLDPTATPTTARNLGYTSSDRLLTALQQISGEEVAAQGSLSTQVSSGQFANISGRLNALRIGGASAASRGRVASLNDQPRNRELYADAQNEPRLGAGASADSQSANQGANRPWGWFIESNYGFGDHDQTASEDGFDFDSVSVSTGTDYNFGNSVIGFSAGFDRYAADFDKATLVSGGDVKVEGVSGSLFGAYFGDVLSLNGIATYGELSSDITRNAVYGTNAVCNPVCGTSRSFTGSPDGSYVALGLSLSRDFNVSGWDITPSLTGSYRNVDIDSYTETDNSTNGGLALAYEDQKIKSTRSIVGIALSRPLSRSFGVLTPNFRAEWHHEFEDDARVLRAKYAVENTLDLSPATTNCVSCFALSTDAADGDFGVAGAGLSATFAQRLQAYLYYEALIGAANLKSNSIALGVRGSF